MSDGQGAETRPRAAACTVRVSRLEDQGKEDDLRGTTAEERIGMMWPLALDAWALMGEPVVDQRLPRSVVRILRRKV